MTGSHAISRGPRDTKSKKLERGWVEKYGEKNSAAAGAIVLFDGVCNLCNNAVQFIIRRDPAGYFKFAPIQSECAAQLLQRYGMRAEATSTFFLIEKNQCLTRSDAALGIARRLSGFWPLLRVVSIVPRPIRDRGYHHLAKNRYRWFGKRETCIIPSKGIMNRFLS